MLLIIFLGLISKLTSVSSDCDFGTGEVKYFDWYKFTGNRPWYWFLHTPNVIDNDCGCPITTYAHPEGNSSLITADIYSISKQRYLRVYGKARHWNSTGYWEEVFGKPFMTWMPAHAIAVDYDRYAILKYCLFGSNKPNAYVLYRSQYPDKATVKDVLKKLKKNKIDVSQLVEYSTEYCQYGK